MRKSSSFVAVVALLGLATGCTSGNSGLQPGYTSANLSNDKLQTAVGIATFNDGTQGLNVVETWRQPSGDSATGLSTPSISGPVGFRVPNSVQAGDDAGTNTISGSLQVLPGKTARPSTFSTTNGVFSYGIQPDNSDTSGELNSSFNTLPFYAADIDPNCTNPSSTDCPQDQFIGGPPAYPNFRDGNYPAAFNGYSEGFTTFYVKPVAGTYTANLTIQTSNAGNYTSPTVSGTLSSLAGLPPWATAPVVTGDGSGGATVSFKAPAGVTETIVNVLDLNTGGVFTAVDSIGQGSVIFPGNIGPGDPVTQTFNKGDTLVVQLAGVDYPAYEASPPSNTKQTPVLAGANGQTDVTFADFEYTFGSTDSTRRVRNEKLLRKQFSHH